MMLKSLALAAVLGTSLVVSGCAGPDKGFLVPLESSAKVSRTLTVLAVTTRTEADQPEKGEIFSSGRSPVTRMMSLTLSMPHGREPGTVPAANGSPDPTKHIALVSARPLSAVEFAALIKSASFRGRRALVFTHGFNTQFDDAVVRFAQIADDTGFKGVPILFSWPSRGAVTDYGYDKDSANFSRDAMEALLNGLAREPNMAGVDIFAHSMGNWLTLETLRQIAIGGNERTLDRIGQVVLAAPDVDMEVFRTQIGRLGALRSRITLYSSKDDHALQLSRRLFGGKIRAGENTDMAEFEKLGIQAHDLSDVKGGLGKNHGKAFGDGTTIGVIGRSMNNGAPLRQQGDIVSNGVAEVGRTITRAANILRPTSE